MNGISETVINEKTYYSVRRVAPMLGVSRGAVLTWIKRGCPCVEVDGQKLINRDEAIGWEKQNKENYRQSKYSKVIDGILHLVCTTCHNPFIPGDGDIRPYHLQVGKMCDSCFDATANVAQKRHSFGKKVLTKEFLTQKLLVECHNISNLAKQLGCSNSVLYNAVKRHGIPIRSSKEKDRYVIDGHECKFCSTCKSLLPLDFFSKSVRCADGLSYHCKFCSKENVSQWAQKNKAKHLTRIHHRRSIERSSVATLKNHDWRSAVLYFNNACAYCGTTGATKKLTLDHFYPLSKGGELARYNVVPACKRCNSSKCAKDPKEWYEAQPFYSAERLLKILMWLTGYGLLIPVAKEA